VNKEDLTEDEAIEVIKEINLPFKSVLITYLNDADEIIAFCNKLDVKVVQLHGTIEQGELQKLKSTRPDIEVIKSLVVRENNFSDLEKIIDTLSTWVDMYITDTFDPSTGASGATGKTHDWNISRKLIQLSTKPVILAGGLNPSNVKLAILETNPAGVDVHTGIERADGRKDFDLTKKFIAECKEAFNQLQD
jgi:phosphoribosylanthranilate isomerase